MNALMMPLTLLRGDDYQEQWGLNDATTGASLIQTGDALTIDVKAFQGASALYTLTGTADANGSLIQAVNPATGSFQPLITHATLEVIASALEGALGATVTGDQLCGAYAFKLTRSGLVTTYAYGPLILLPAP